METRRWVELKCKILFNLVDDATDIESFIQNKLSVLKLPKVLYKIFASSGLHIP